MEINLLKNKNDKLNKINNIFCTLFKNIFIIFIR